jgi:hypothetical protein
MKIDIKWYVNDEGLADYDVLKFRRVTVQIARPYYAPKNVRAPLLASTICPFCQQPNVKPISRKALKEIQDWGASNCLDLDASLRELFITGICDKCWPDEPDE